MSISQVLKAVQTDGSVGLTDDVAADRLARDGENTLPTSGQAFSTLRIFLSQWKSPLILILLAAGTLSAFLGETADMIIIYLTTVFNACIGFFQEYKASRALEQLRSMVEYSAVVIRGGIKKSVPSTHIVVGDILCISPGDKVQADGRLMVADHLEINEATVTGESVPEKKGMEPIAADAVLGDRTNMIFRGTEVVNGEACAVVTATGVQTAIGQIAMMVRDTREEQTPLQMQLARLARIISIVVLCIAVLLFLLGIAIGTDQHSVFQLFETAVAVAVAAIPEGLVISLTVILAIGMQQILKRRALVRRPVAAETLGSVSVICVDKTGTLTEGHMRVAQLLTTDLTISPDQLRQISLVKDPHYHTARLSLHIAILANTGSLENPDAPEKDWHFTGDTTDIALLHMGMLADMGKDHLDHAYPRIAYIPFSSEQKYTASLHETEQGSAVYAKGAPEIIFSRCTFYETPNGRKKMNKEVRIWFETQMQQLTHQGYRTLAVAYKEVDGATTIDDGDIGGLTFVGLFALADPVRADVKETLRLAQRAGIRTIMITGDHVKTAQAIAQQVELSQGDSVYDGAALDELSDQELIDVVETTQVFARVDPRHKIRIVRALQAKGEVVAMTGDGVNDAPALKGADIGIAVGSGTDVAKETADMVLLHNGISTIIAAIEEGRRIYQNIKTVVLYLLSGSFAEVILIAGSLLTGMPLAILPAQILWINIIEESFPTMALAFDKGDGRNMADPPRKKHVSLLDREMKTMIGLVSVVSSGILFVYYMYVYNTTGDVALARTLMFAGLGVLPLLYIYSVRSLRTMIWRMRFFDNHFLTGAVLFGWAMLLVGIYLHPFQQLLHTVPLALSHWIILASFAVLNVCIIESIKWIFLIKKV